jgi:hypothetical protein
MMICCWHILMLPMIDVLIFRSSDCWCMTCNIVFGVLANDITVYRSNAVVAVVDSTIASCRFVLQDALNPRSSDCHTPVGTLCEVSFSILANHFTGSAQSLSLSTSQWRYAALSRRVSSWTPGR